MTKEERIWSRKVQIINGRRPRSRTRSEDEPDSSPMLMSKYDRSFSNNTTLADMDEQQHARWYVKTVAEAEGGIEMEAPGRVAAVGCQSPSSFSEAGRSPLSRQSTLWF